MRVEDVLKLIDAGYSKDEIVAMEQPEQKEEEKKEPEQKEEEKKEPEQKDGNEDHDRDIVKQMEQMLKDMWDANIKKSKMPESEETAEDIIATIITPKKKEN